jgi:enoyl-CoA hydratase/carnithine racemase
MICAADVRYASSNAYFCVKEAELGLAADVGTLQRLPRVIGSDSLARELAYTARNMGADEAARVGLVR